MENGYRLLLCLCPRYGQAVDVYKRQVLKTETVEPLAEQVALGGIVVKDLIVIAVVEVEGGDDGFLQGSGCLLYTSRCV